MVSWLRCVVGWVAGFDEALHAQEIVLHALLGIRAEQPRDAVGDGAGGRVVAQSERRAGFAVWGWIEADAAGVWHRRACDGAPGDQLVGDLAGDFGIPVDRHAAGAFDGPARSAVAEV